MTFSGKQMEIEKKLLSEVTHVQKDKHFIFPFIFRS